MRQLPFNLFAGLLVLSFVIFGFLGRNVISDLRELTTATNDDVSWRMSQLEVELLRFQNAILEAQRTESAALTDVRKRYDIFFSRISTVSQSALSAGFQQDATATNSLDEARAFLKETTPLIDADDDTLRAELPAIYEQTIALRPELRVLALSGVRVFNAQEKTQRQTVSHALENVGLGLLVLIAVLIAALAILIKLYRQGEAISKASEIARSRFEAAVSSSLDAVLVVDRRGHIVEFNGAAETVFGFSRDEALGEDMSELIVPEHMREAHRKGMQRFLDTGEKKVIGAGRVRLEGLRKSGEVFPVELSISISEASGETVFVSFLRDITDELQAEEDLRDALAKAQVGEQAKSKLLTVMSHEMRTPLNGILGSLELIDQTDLTDTQKRHLNSIGVSGELLLSHVNDVLDLSVLASDQQQSELTVFDLESLVQNVVNSLQGNADSHGNTLTADFLTPGLGMVQGYETPLQRCLVNLVGNAIKFTQDGAVSVEVERVSDSDQVEIRVTDTGVGIAPENLDRIFEEFVTIDAAFDRKNSGSGLGLAITKGLIDQCKGTITADSVPGEGSMFTVLLPLPIVSTEPTATAIPVVQTLPDLPTAFRVLVVDDNEINRVVLSDILVELGGIPTEADNGFDAIELTREQHFDVLMLDISMPEIDGIETLKRIRALSAKHASIPAIAVTAHASPKDHEKIRAAGFDNLLVKPLDRASTRQSLATELGLLPVEENNSLEQETETEFMRRFGEERFRSALNETLMEIQALAEDLRSAPDLCEPHTSEAHRLSGSAAVLGQTKLWSALQDIQNVRPDKWLDQRQDLLKPLDREVEQSASVISSKT